MEKQAFVFIGRSGCGKGTQAELLMDFLNNKDKEKKSLYIQTGEIFREYIKGNSHTQNLAKKIYDEGGLMPEFLSVLMWSRTLSEKYNGIDYLIFDGTPRKLHEAGVLESIFNFYNFKKPKIIHLNVSREWSKKRLLERKRFDDNADDIENRLNWYDTDVSPTIDFYRSNILYNFLDINGERSIEEIHKDILSKCNLI